MKIRILVGSDAFWAALRRDLAGARERVYVQTLSFEDDDVGRALADELFASAAPDRRMLVDAFIDVMLRDRMRYWPHNLLDRDLREHAKATQRLIDSLCRGGVPVRKTNGLRPLLTGFFSRNHKKLVIVDDAVAYTGGINFCDHNFAWHDIMVRLEGADVTSFLAEDFLGTWEGRNTHRTGWFGWGEVHVLDGVSNARAFEPILDLIGAARQRIFIHSPYVTFPFLDRVAEAAARGVQVTLLTPADNNYPVVTPYIVWTARRAGIELRVFPGMSHLKAVLVDDALILGSCNFDYPSYRGHQEVILVIRDPAVIAEFERLVIEPDMARSTPWSGTAHPLLGRTLNTLLRVTGSIGMTLNGLTPPKRVVAASREHPVPRLRRGTEVAAL